MSMEWESLLEHPAWRKVVKLLGDDRKSYVTQLISLASMSTDPNVAKVAQQIQAIDEIVALPEKERDFERTKERAALTP